MKKLKKMVLFLFILVFTTGCNDLSLKENKTTYQEGEIATVDYYDVTLNDVNYEQGYISLDFEVKNNDSVSHSILEDNFGLVIDGQEQNIKMNSAINLNLNSNQSKTFTITYPVEYQEEDMGILFYSKVVTNNIMFEIEI